MNEAEETTSVWLDKLRHMLGAGAEIRKRDHGYRNRYCAEIGSPDYATMLEMEAEGLVIQGPKINDGRSQYFQATRDGCEAIGLSKAATKRALHDN